MDSFLHDLRYGLRMLVKSPGFTAVAVITLALGIGANTAVFSIVNAVLLRPLPYRDPQQLVKIWGQYPNQGIPQNWISEPEWWDMQGLHSFSSLAAYVTNGGVNLSTPGTEPARITRSAATSSLFPLLGVTPAQGRTFSSEEDQPGRDHAVLLSYACWTSKFGADPKIVGSTVELNLEKYTVVGVLPKDFAFGGDADIWTPLGLDKAKPAGRGGHYLEVIGRLAPGVTAAQAGSEMASFATSLARQYPDNYRADSGWNMFIRPLRTELVGDVRTATLVVFAAVGFVLLIACVNVANLLLARASARSREMAMRAALGAGRWRLIQQLLTESVLIGCVGGALGIGLAFWGTSLMGGLAADVLPEGTKATLDLTVLGFAVFVSIATGILFGLVPALHVSRPGLFDTLKTAARSSPAASSHRTRNGLVVAEISIALVLLVAAGLMVRSLRHLMEVNPGFQAQNVLTARIFLPTAKYKDQASTIPFFRDLVERLRSQPGVEAAGAVSLLPVNTTGSSGTTIVEDTQVQGLPILRAANKPFIEADRRMTEGRYFEALRIALISGRYFNDADNENGSLVAIVDQSFAKRFWPNQDPLGKRIAIGSVPNSNPPAPQWRTIVGIVAHVKNKTLDQDGREQVYVPQAQVPYIRNMSVVLRTAMEPAAAASSIRSQLAAIDPTLPLYEVRTMDDQLERSTAQRRFNMSLLVGFGLLALILAAIGTYGVLSYSVGQRTSEIGIRMALGAGSVQILRMVVGDGLRLAAAGVGVGLLTAVVATRFMASMLFGVGVIDPLSFAIASLVLVTMALLAAYVPARRATRVDPIIALRNE